MAPFATCFMVICFACKINNHGAGSNELIHQLTIEADEMWVSFLMNAFSRASVLILSEGF